MEYSLICRLKGKNCKLQYLKYNNICKLSNDLFLSKKYLSNMCYKMLYKERIKQDEEFKKILSWGKEIK